MTPPPGWHPDPAPPQPGAPALLRWWDGARWTEHTAPASPMGGGYQQVQGRSTTTPDGMPLAGWWQRVLAYLLDSILLLVVGGVLALPWWRDVFHDFRDWVHEANAAADAGRSMPDASGLQRDLRGALVMIGLINAAVSFAYSVGFLMWKQATIGKLVVGLRVRLRERPGPMPLGTVLLRWVGQFGPGLLGIVPYVGGLSGLYSLLDDLWPLWDDKRQALHDKVAKTNVVRIR